MHFNLELILVLLAALTGAIWAADAAFFRARRQRRMLEAQALAAARGKDAPPAAEPTVVEYARSFFPIIVLVLLIRSFIAEPFRIPSSSMMPTLLIGDFIVVNKFAYGIRLPVLRTKVLETGQPQRGDVAVFKWPVDPRLDYIKRIVGLPGDEIVYRNRQLFINGQAIEQSPQGRFVGRGQGREATGSELRIEHLGEHEHAILLRPDLPLRAQREGRWLVPEGHYFVIGDNRDNSQDSRYWGFVPESHLVGRATLVWMSWDAGVQFSRIGTRIR